MTSTAHGRVSAFYVSIVLYVLFIFTTQWSLAVAKMGNVWLHDILSNIVTFMILPAILSLIVYSIASNFHFYYRRRWFTISFITMLFIIAIASKSLSLTLPLLIGFAGFAAQNRKIAKIALISFSTLLFLSYLFSLVGLNGGDTLSKPLFGTERTELSGVTALGLANPNAVMLIVFNVVALALFLSRYGKRDVVTAMCLTVFVATLSVATGSTTGLIIGLATILVMLYAKYGKKSSKRLRRLTPWAFTIVTVLTFLVSISFGSNQGIEGGINDLLTGRPELWNLRIENNSYVNLFGNNDQYQVNRVPGSDEVTQALDNTPLYLLVYLGAIVYLIFWYIFYVGSKYTKDTGLLAYILIATLLMFAEKMELYGLVLLFLQKSITEHKLRYSGSLSVGSLRTQK